MATEIGNINVHLHNVLPKLYSHETTMWLSARASQVDVALFMSREQLVALAHSILAELAPLPATVEVSDIVFGDPIPPSTATVEANDLFADDFVSTVSPEPAQESSPEPDVPLYPAPVYVPDPNDIPF